MSAWSASSPCTTPPSPSTSELIDWLTVLVRSGLDPDTIRKQDPFLGVLLKQQGDLDLATGKRKQRAF